MKSYFRQSIAVVVIGLASLLIYVSSLERPPHNDELYHMLAARGLLETGEPSIGEDGRYWRGYPLTWIVAQSLWLFGDSLSAGRLPPVLFMVGLVILLFLFLRREVDSLAAWLGAGLFAVSPFAIDMAQFVRFYSLQGLSFFAGAWLVYHLVDERSWRQPWPWLRAAAAAVLFGFAAQLQVTSMLGIIGLGLWSASAVLLAWLATPQRSHRQNLVAVAGLLALGAAALALLAATGILARLWADFRVAPLFNQPNVDQFWFYHVWYVLFYPTLWTLVGLLTVLALIRRTKPASFAMTIFGVGLILNSIAGPKSLRYIFYAQPYLFILWGMGLAVIVRWMFDANGLAGLPRRLADRLSLLSGRWAAIVARALLFGALLFAVLTNPAWLRSVTLLAGITVPPEQPPTLWQAARPTLQPWLDGAEVVVVAEELNPLYFYGRADIVLNASRYYEIPSERRFPFAPDHRTDVPSIPDAASLERAIDCYGSGLFVIEEQFWGPDAHTLRDPEVEDLLLLRTERLPLPSNTRLVAFTWTTAPDTIHAADCQGLPVIDR
jgi:hypothetical protein